MIGGMEPKQQPPYPVRMPPELRSELEKEAAISSRSLNAEVVSRLQASVDGSDGFHLPEGILKKLQVAAKKAGRTVDSELLMRTIDSLAEMPPAEERLRNALEEERQRSRDLWNELEALRADSASQGTTLYVLLDTNGYPIAWSEIHEILGAIHKTGGFKPRETRTLIITPDMESSSRRVYESVMLARALRKGGKSAMLSPKDVVDAAAMPPAAGKRKSVPRKPKS